MSSRSNNTFSSSFSAHGPSQPLSRGPLGSQNQIVEARDLEDYIDLLRKFDEWRRRAESAVNASVYEGLNKLIEDALEPDKNPFDTGKPDFDLDDYVNAIRVSCEGPHKPSSEIETRLQKIIEFTTFANLKEEYSNVLTASSILRALVSSRTWALSNQTFRCYYWVLKELYTAAEPDWCVGGARAADDGWITAFVTAQCVHAIVKFSGALEAAAKFFSAIQVISDGFLNLEDSASASSWMKVDLDRVCTSSLNTFKFFRKRLPFEIDPPNQADFQDYLKNHFPGVIEKVCREAERSLREVKSEIEDPNNQSQPQAHKAVLTILDLLTDTSGLLGSRNWRGLSELFQKLAKLVLRALKPSEQYLSGKIDQQLEASHSSSGKDWEPFELAWAAAAYKSLRPSSSEDGVRLVAAISCVSESISEDGTVPKVKPFHRNKERNVSVLPSPGAMLEPLADLIRGENFPLDLRLAGKLLPFFEHTRVRPPDAPGTSDQRDGWASIFSRQPSEAELYYSWNAIDSLKSIKQMFDVIINHLILRHFSVKQPSELKETTKVDLNDLFYPDYGFAALSPNDDKFERVQRESVAITLQRMRAHIEELKWSGDSRGEIHSLVLHGPAGTGKTTLVEALALTCGVPLIEITPSDISKSGQEAIERRARAVFEALSLLTKVVILFDEFDPVLKRRGTATEGTENILSFLTPGMLPKLKTLREKAKKRSVAYVLITNLVGKLDEAAIRTGRFDEKVGIYPPDPLSRYGRLIQACKQTIHVRNEGTIPAEIDERIRRVVSKTKGAGMTALTRKGWFRDPKPDENLKDSPLGYILYASSEPAKWPQPEDRLEMRGKGHDAETEYVQWGWIDQWDVEVEKDKSAIDKWYFSVESGDWIKRLRNNVRQTYDQRLLTGLLGDEIVLRWRTESHLQPRLKEVFTKPFPKDIDQAKLICSSLIFSSEDLYIFKRCAEQVFSNKSFHDPALTSSTVHVYMLANDFAAKQKILAHHLKSASVNPEQIRSIWQELKSIYERIDDQMYVLYSRINEDYKAYVESSDFIKSLQSLLGGDIKDMKSFKEHWEHELQEVAKKRHGRLGIS